MRTILPTITGFGLFVLAWGLHPFGWEPAPHPTWSWILCGLGLLITIGSVVEGMEEPHLNRRQRRPVYIYMGGMWLTAEQFDRTAQGLVCIGGLLMIGLGWYLEFVLLALSYILGGVLYLASFVLVGLGAREFVTTRRRVKDAFSNEWQRQSAGRNSRDDDETFSDKQRRQQREGDAAGSRHEASASFDPWHVLEIARDATREEIHNAFREQMKRYHPDRVSHLGEELREVAERKTKDINRAYQMLSRR